jgi:hypothetical protein
LNNLPGGINTDYRHVAKPWPLAAILEELSQLNKIPKMVTFSYFWPKDKVESHCQEDIARILGEASWL